MEPGFPPLVHPLLGAFRTGKCENCTGGSMGQTATSLPAATTTAGVGPLYLTTLVARFRTLLYTACAGVYAVVALQAAGLIVLLTVLVFGVGLNARASDWRRRCLGEGCRRVLSRKEDRSLVVECENGESAGRGINALPTQRADVRSGVGRSPTLPPAGGSPWPNDFVCLLYCKY